MSLRGPRHVLRYDDDDSDDDNDDDNDARSPSDVSLRCEDGSVPCHQVILYPV